MGNIFAVFKKSEKIVHFEMGAEGDYLAYVAFFARAKRVSRRCRED